MAYMTNTNQMPTTVSQATGLKTVPAVWQLALDCGHVIDINKPKKTDMPAVGRMVYCPVCGREQEVVDTNPSYAATKIFRCDDGRKGLVIYSSKTGTWGYNDIPFIVNGFLDLGATMGFSSEEKAVEGLLGKWPNAIDLRNPQEATA